MENCCENLVKYFMIFCNILFVLAGFILIGFGAWSQIDAKDYLNFLGENYVNTPIFIIIVGCIIFVIAFFGCCGAWKESSCLVYSYAVLLSVILIAQIGAGIAAYMLKSDLSGEVTKNMKAGMDNYEEPDFEGVTHTWDIMQQNLKCCGVETPADWHVRREDLFPAGEVPDSCCKEGHKKNCGQDPAVAKFDQGCFEIFESHFVDNIATIGGVALGVAIVEFLAVIFACCLGKRMRDSYSDGRYV